MAPVFRRLRAHGGGKLHELPLRGLTSDSSILPLSGTGAGPPRLLGRGEGVPLSASGRAGPSRLEERYMLMVRASPRLANVRRVPLGARRGHRVGTTPLLAIFSA